MAAAPDLDARLDGDPPLRRGPALWEAGPPLPAILVTPLLVALFLSPFWGFALYFLLDPSDATVATSLKVAGVPVQLDPDSAFQVHYALIAVFLLWPAILVGSALIRKIRLRYRLDGVTVAVLRGGALVDRIEVAEIREAGERGALLWRQVRIARNSGRPIDLQLRAADAARLLDLLRRLGVAREVETAPIPEIAAGEAVRWQGRQGFAALDKLQMIASLFLFLPILIYLWPLRWIWSGGLPLYPALFMSFIWTALWGGLAGGMAFAYAELVTRWIRAAFGTLLVTDRRIAWREPGSDHLYRELALSELVDAAIVEQKGHRAWVGLTIRKGTDNGEALDLRGITEADRFLAALRIRP